MANHASHAALPYCIRKCRYTIVIPYLDADGDPTDPTTPDTEISKSGGAFADCEEEVTLIGSGNGVGYLTLSGDETDTNFIVLICKSASGPKYTLQPIFPTQLTLVATGTAQAGASGSITLTSGAPSYDLAGCFVLTTGGTGGGGGIGDRDNQARIITSYDPDTKVASVSPNWETTPDNTTTYAIRLPIGQTVGSLKAVNPTTAGRTLDVSANGEAGIDWANIGSPTTTVALTGTTVSSSQVAASVTGNVGGNVTGSVGSVASGGITSASFAANSLTAAALAADAVSEIQSGLSTLTAANVNAEVLDVLSVDTFAELASPPAATSSLKDKLIWLFMYCRNKVTQTATQRKVYADDTVTVVGTETVSDDGTTFTKGEAS